MIIERTRRGVTTTEQLLVDDRYGKGEHGAKQLGAGDGDTTILLSKWVGNGDDAKNTRSTEGRLALSDGTREKARK